MHCFNYTVNGAPIRRSKDRTLLKSTIHLSKSHTTIRRKVKIVSLKSLTGPPGQPNLMYNT